MLMFCVHRPTPGARSYNGGDGFSVQDALQPLEDVAEAKPGESSYAALVSFIAAL
jgi:hypothetical protein